MMRWIVPVLLLALSSCAGRGDGTWAHYRCGEDWRQMRVLTHDDGTAHVFIYGRFAPFAMTRTQTGTVDIYEGKGVRAEISQRGDALVLTRDGKAPLRCSAEVVVT